MSSRPRLPSRRKPSSPAVPASGRTRADVVAALLLVVAAAACGGKDPYAPVAQLNTVGTTFTIYPQSRVQAPYASALDLRNQLSVRPSLYVSSTTGTLVPNFDVAFDLDSAGRIVLIPPKLITSAQTLPRTGFQISSTAFDSLRSAPGGSYQADSAVRVLPGQTIVVQAEGASVPCPSSAPFFFSKLVIDAYDPTTGALSIRARIDPNCGFKSFAAGIPES